MSRKTTHSTILNETSRNKWSFMCYSVRRAGPLRGLDRGAERPPGFASQRKPSWVVLRVITPLCANDNTPGLDHPPGHIRGYQETKAFHVGTLPHRNFSFLFTNSHPEAKAKY